MNTYLEGSGHVAGPMHAFPPRCFGPSRLHHLSLAEVEVCGLYHKASQLDAWPVNDIHTGGPRHARRCTPLVMGKMEHYSVSTYVAVSGPMLRKKVKRGTREIWK